MLSKSYCLSALIHNYGNVLEEIFFHRRGAEGAESYYFLFAVERTANKKIQALRAKHKSALRIARRQMNMK